jgi:hypothetical protein
MLFTSLAAITLSATSLVSPFTRIFHMHPSLKVDKISVSIQNQSHTFQEVSINGHSYTIYAQQWLHVRGPVGTTVVADSNHGTIHRGDTIVVLEPQLDNTRVVVK